MFELQKYQHWDSEYALLTQGASYGWSRPRWDKNALKTRFLFETSAKTLPIQQKVKTMESEICCS